jgi:hypothetical protein
MAVVKRLAGEQAVNAGVIAQRFRFRHPPQFRFLAGGELVVGSPYMGEIRGFHGHFSSASLASSLFRLRRAQAMMGMSSGLWV